MRALALVALVFLASPAAAESVDVKYRGAVDLAPFTCHDITRSSFIRRVCYDARERYMLIKLDSAYYHYCQLDPQTYAALLAAKSMGRYYNQHIKGEGKDGPFDCRSHRMPTYKVATPNCTPAFEKAWTDHDRLAPPATWPKPLQPCILRGNHGAYLCTDDGCSAQ